MGQLALECLIRVNTWANTVMGCPLLCYVMEYSTGQVLAYGLASQETGEEQCALVLYEAILAARRPSSSASAGLLWHLPHRLVTACSLPWDCQKACRALLIAIEYQHELPAFAQAFPSDWAAHLAGRMLSSQQCLLLFDAYLAKHVPPSPLRVQEEQRRQ